MLTKRTVDLADASTCPIESVQGHVTLHPMLRHCKMYIIPDIYNSLAGEILRINLLSMQVDSKEHLKKLSVTTV